MTFHLPGKLFSVTVSNAETPFSSCWLKPGLTPVTLNDSSLSPMVFMRFLLLLLRRVARQERSLGYRIAITN
jgi:hypothetical protein